MTGGVHYLEIVSDDADALIALYERMYGLSFGAELDADLGNARVAVRPDGSWVGIRKPLAAHEKVGCVHACVRRLRFAMMRLPLGVLLGVLGLLEVEPRCSEDSLAVIHDRACTITGGGILKPPVFRG